jgi:hypothetical protein
MFHTTTLSVLKKSALLFAVIAFGIASFSSCRSSESCPAYGKADVPVEQSVKA